MEYTVNANLSVEIEDDLSSESEDSRCDGYPNEEYYSYGDSNLLIKSSIPKDRYVLTGCNFHNGFFFNNFEWQAECVYLQAVQLIIYSVLATSNSIVCWFDKYLKSKLRNDDLSCVLIFYFPFQVQSCLFYILSPWHFNSFTVEFFYDGKWGKLSKV